ncbi:rhomboid-domain-containing protein [Pseudovirgaria hyperparasitica]|uniref:Rhomboid-type serine protease n=1 Tax=Pseudovirgaria hyperparasitica TaxID=470096 RepID=A0A6A6WBH2_9PEZI|nr:rhomboid-domain-containing protein [Pseudovirgaria hyperparasitica]KAF2759186.1 rhomboid-domain-containing protein [Pseudovirgaria hyperparasitica]
MAANDYYNNQPYDDFHHAGPQSSGALGGVGGGRQHDAHDISPVASPFDDRNQAYSHQHPDISHQPSLQTMDSSYHGAAGNPYATPSPYNHSSDPFADQNAIPLHAASSQAPLNPKDGNGVYGVDAEGQSKNRGQRGNNGRYVRKKEGWFTGKITYVCFTLTLVQIGVFIGALIKNAVATGTPIMIKPSFNFMIGPSPWTLINMGSRYTPCMHNLVNVTGRDPPVSWPCPNATSLTGPFCSLSELCGFGGFPTQPPGTAVDDRSQEPNQWWRFIVPIFLHVGIIHIAFNMLLQMTLGRDMEKQVGSIRFALVYFSSGIFGFVLGGNYAAPLLSSVGASGAIFGIIGLVLLDILYTWKDRPSPVKDLLFLMLDIIVMIILGFLPGLDNFSHIGGLLMGIVLGICILHSPNVLRARTGEDEPPYAAVSRNAQDDEPAIKAFVRQPLGFFAGRKPLWWAWWLFRAGALVAVLIGFILLLRNFYVDRNECQWCRKLCIPIKNWCEQGNAPEVQVSNQTKRELLFGMDAEWVGMGWGV